LEKTQDWLVSRFAAKAGGRLEKVEMLSPPAVFAAAGETAAGLVIFLDRLMCYDRPFFIHRILP